MNWPHFYSARRLGDSYVQYCRERYKPFINAIHDWTPPQQSLLEIGCGMGTITQIFAEYYLHHYLLDSDADMLNMARCRLNRYRHKMTFIKGDARDHDYSPYSVHTIHSHGVLEHHSDDDILWIVKQAAKHCTVQIHYVPGLYDKPSFGDERLLPITHWIELLNPIETFTFNGALDYGLIILNNQAASPPVAMAA
jgi:trans-aconitate methyltransferase